MKTLDEYAEVINAVLGGRKPTAQERGVLEAARCGKGCADCGRPIGPTDPVYLVRKLDWQNLARFLEAERGLPIRLATNTSTPICRDCAAEFIELPPTETLPRCDVCGRPVARLTDKRRRLYNLCCDRCRRHQAHRLEALTRTALGADKTCPICGETSSPARSDAKTCSPKCRTRLYRTRVAGDPRRARRLE